MDDVVRGLDRSARTQEPLVVVGQLSFDSIIRSTATTSAGTITGDIRRGPLGARRVWRRMPRHEFALEPVGVPDEELVESRGVRGADDQAGVMVLLNPPARSRDRCSSTCRAVLRARDSTMPAYRERRRRVVGAVLARDLDVGPLAPEIDAGRRFDDVDDEGAADASGGFEEIPARRLRARG